VAKQSRARPRPTATSSRDDRRSSGTPRPSRSAVTAVPRSETYGEAVAVYQRGIEALQRRDFAGAAAHFNAVLERYPEERELHERARLYLRVCERGRQPRPAAPRTVDDRVYAATIALNAGREDEALALLSETAEAADGRIDYMMAIVLTRRGDRAGALARLRRAVDLDPDNGLLARRDADFGRLADDPAFREVTQPPAAGRRRPRARQR
jgi:tetratricopeptide (TPR) repeat protein